MANGIIPSTSEAMPSGATMRPRYMVREMNTYAVTESEMESISELNTEATIFFSAAALFLGFAASIWASAIFATEATPEGSFASHYGAPGMLLAGGIFAALGIMAIRKRATLWKRICSESAPTQATSRTMTLAVPVAGDKIND